MAHNLSFEGGKAALMYVGEVPWHGLGTRLETPPKSAAEAIEAAGLNWEVGLMPVYCADANHFYEIPEKKSIVRLDKWGQPDFKPFGLVGSDYQVLQNRDAFKFFDPLLSTGSIAFETAGALGHGERVWVMAKVEGEGKIADDDVVDRYLLLSTGHDGKTAVQVRFTPIRVVCQNTLMWSLESGTDFAKVYHVAGMQRELSDVQESLKSILKRFESVELRFANMVQVALDDANLESYLASVFPTPKKKEKQSVRSHEKAVATVEEMRKRSAKNFASGRGNENKAVAGSLWAAYNGVVEFLDHQKLYRDQWHRLNSLWFGDDAKVKQRAYDEACKHLPA